MNFMLQSRRRRVFVYFLTILAGILVSTGVLVGVILLSNRNLPSGLTSSDRLLEIDKVRLQEALALRQELGDEVWPGFAGFAPPVILWNQDYEFLLGISEPPAGWELVPDDTFNSEPYYRRPAGDPENFAVQVGDQQVCSIFTKDQLDLELITALRENLPPALAEIFPYRLSIQPSELQIALVQHECFHVYQSGMRPAKFQAAEAVYAYDNQYWAADTAMRSAWNAEMEALRKAAISSSEQQTLDWARKFLGLRDERRAAYQLDPNLLAYERQLEWLEGSAKYVEMQSWQTASLTPDYIPLPGLKDDPDFKNYETFDSHWQRELSLAGQRAGQEGDLRFYYSGMLQGVVLNRLMPGWQARLMDEGIFFEDLLRETVE